MAALMQMPQRLRDLPDAADRFFIDKPGVKSLYMRAFSMDVDAEGQTIDIARQLIREFPDDQNMISRWVNQADVQDIEYESLLLDMEANDLRRQIRAGGGLAESVQLQKRLAEVQRQQRKLNEQLNDTGA